MATGTEGMSALELAILTPEERAALSEETSAEEAAARTAEATSTIDAPAAAPAPATATVDDDDDPPRVTDEGAKDVIETPAPTAQAPAPEAEATTAEVDREPFVAKMPVGEAVDYDAKLADLSKRFEDGEVSTAEYNAELTHILSDKIQQEQAARFNEAVEKQLWERAKEDFFGANEQYKKSAVLFGALGAAIGQIEKDAAEGKIARPSGSKLLSDAHAIVMREFGQVPPAASAKPKATTSRVGQPPDLASVPTTLAAVPSAQEPDTGTDRFAELDRLAETDATEWERRLAAMSPQDQAAYLALQ